MVEMAGKGVITLGGDDFMESIEYQVLCEEFGEEVAKKLIAGEPVDTGISEDEIEESIEDWKI